jgi:peptidoglycan/LPS O-acetylase OafA/YrhL
MAATATTAVVSSTRDISHGASQKPRRIFALDSTKGILVLTMVLYHWMNYFVPVNPSVYRYLRFLTPSFIFITGFLISYVYLKREKASSQGIPKRLVIRGLKLLAIVLALNIGPVLLTAHTSLHATETKIVEMVLDCFLGWKAIAFSVLVPIAYLLIGSGVLLVAFQRYRMTFHVISVAAVGSALVLAWMGVDSSYLQLASIGALGISVGHCQIERINSFLKHRLFMLTAYVGYLIAITVWNATYPLQIIGVCLSVGVIYMFAEWCGESGYFGRTMILLGQYSLFGYIIQIVILQITHRVSGVEPGGGIVGLAFAACIAGTIAAVKIVAWTRIRYRPANTLYTAIFG